MTINSNNFINSLNHRQKPQVILKNVIVEGVLIKDTPVINDNRQFEDVVSSDTLSKIYKLIKMYPDKKVIHFDD